MQFGKKSKNGDRVFIHSHAVILADRRGKLKFIIGATDQAQTLTHGKPSSFKETFKNRQVME